MRQRLLYLRPRQGIAAQDLDADFLQMPGIRLRPQHRYNRTTGGTLEPRQFEADAAAGTENHKRPRVRHCLQA
ncbi:hypothetical protein D3C71_1620670 [compost metagenome]